MRGSASGRNDAPSRRNDTPARRDDTPSRRLEFAEDEGGGVTVLADGHPQSYVDPHDPELLVFEYVQHLAACLDALPEAAPARLAITHVGGAGLSVPRYVQHTRPGSPQIVLEPDEDLTARVRRELPLPRGHRIRVRPLPGRAGVTGLRPASADVLVLDAFADGRVPADLTTLEAFVEAARVLRPGGLWLGNLADEPGRGYVARVAASAHACGLTHQLLVATHDVLKGRRFGNSVLAASGRALDADELGRRLRRVSAPSGVLAPARLARLRASARPLTDSDAHRSAPPPDPGRWRAR